MGLFWHEYYSRSPFPSLKDIPDPGIESMSPALQADSLPSEPFIYDGKFNGHGLGQTLEDGEGQGCLACCRPRVHKELDMTR